MWIEKFENNKKYKQTTGRTIEIKNNIATLTLGQKNGKIITKKFSLEKLNNMVDASVGWTEQKN